LDYLKQNTDIIVILGHLSQDQTNLFLDDMEGYQIFVAGHQGAEFKYPRIVNDKIYMQNGNYSCSFTRNLEVGYTVTSEDRTFQKRLYSGKCGEQDWNFYYAADQMIKKTLDNVIQASLKNSAISMNADTTEVNVILDNGLSYSIQYKQGYELPYSISIKSNGQLFESKYVNQEKILSIYKRVVAKAIADKKGKQSNAFREGLEKMFKKKH